MTKTMPSRTGEAHAEAEANARLIAAAPDLLDVARMLIESSDNPGGGRFSLADAVIRARAAIAKAEGR